MAKNKKYKLNAHDKEMVSCFRNSAQENAEKSIEAGGIEFIEENRDGSYRLTAAVKFRSFDLLIYYYPSVMLGSDYIDFALKFEGSELRFSIYDVFNHLDIKDFDLYYYSDCDVKSSVDNAVNSIFDVCRKYMADIEYVSKSAVTELEKQFNSELSDWWSAEEENEPFNDFEWITLCRPSYYGDNSEKVLKKLRKQEKKECNTLYEKRLLKYLEAGNTLSITPAAHGTEARKKFLRADILSTLLIGVASFVLVFAVAIIVQKSIFGGAYVPLEDFFLSKLLGLSLNQCIITAMAGLFLTTAIRFSFGGKIISRFADEGDAESFSVKFITENLGMKNKKLAKVFGWVVTVICTLLCILMLSMGSSNIGFYDNYAKFIPDNYFSPCEVTYEDLEIYRLQYYLDDDEELVEAENAYAVADKQHTVYYSIGEVAELGKTEKYLLDISSEYGIEIQQIRDIDSLAELCGGAEE